jgi:hypothetical protein
MSLKFLPYRCGVATPGPIAGGGANAAALFPVAFSRPSGKSSKCLLTLRPRPFTCRSVAQMAELVDAQVSGTCAARRGGSSPLLGTIPFKEMHKKPGFPGFLRFLDV